MKKVRKCRQYSPRTENQKRIKNKIKNQQWDDIPKREKTSARFQYGYQDKECNSYSTSYSWRWLKKNIGKDWNDLYSQLCKTIPKHSHYLFLCHVYHKTKMIDGKIYTCEYSFHPIDEYSNRPDGKFYVHPETNKLCFMKPSKYANSKVKDPNKKIIDGQEYQKINGAWTEVTLCPFARLWPGFEEYYTTKRTLSKKELKRLGFSEKNA